MRILSKREADNFLSPKGLEIGPWGEVAATDESILLTKSFVPSKNALELFVVAMRLNRWLDCKVCALLQADNSTFPTADEISIARIILGPTADEWFSSANRSFLFDVEAGFNSNGLDEKISLIIYFSVIFEWHIHIVSDRKNIGMRLSIQDGLVSLHGNENQGDDMDLLVADIVANPLALNIA